MKGWGDVLMEVLNRGGFPNGPHFPLSRIQ